MNELEQELEKVIRKWKTQCAEEYGGNAKKWLRENLMEIQNDISDLWLLEKLQGLIVIEEGMNNEQ